MKQLLIASVLILMAMSGMAVAEGDRMHGMMSSECSDCTDAGYDAASLPCEQFDVSSTEFEVLETDGVPVTGIEEEWLYERRNVVPEGLEYAYWNFNEGGNLVPFQNQHPSVAAFMNVISDSYAISGSDEPSYIRKCAPYMHIYPCDYYSRFHDEPVDFIYIVNGDAAFAPRTMNHIGQWYPGREAYLMFKDDTHYVSFLACTGGTLKIRMYDNRGKVVHYATIYENIDRVGTEPANFTRFSVYIPDKPIAAMKVSGFYNAWSFDDLVVGGEPGYLPEEPVNYTYVARRAQELYEHEVDYLEYGLGHDYEVFDYMDSWQFNDGAVEEYWNPETKQFEEGEGISNAGLILWAYNYDSDELAGTSFVKRNTVAGMEKHDFTVDVDPANTQPGDVCFMDRKDRNGDYGSDGYADEVYMVIEETPAGNDLIYSCPDDNTGVIYSEKSIVEGSPAFMGYKRLPGVIRGGKNPIPKGH